MGNEPYRWYQVFEWFVATIQVLTERHLPFRGSDEHIGTLHYNTFLDVIGKFESIIEEHIQNVQNKEINDHYLEKIIQNNLIDNVEKSLLTILSKCMEE